MGVTPHPHHAATYLVDTIPRVCRSLGRGLELTQPVTPEASGAVRALIVAADATAAASRVIANVVTGNTRLKWERTLAQLAAAEYAHHAETLRRAAAMLIEVAATAKGLTSGDLAAMSSAAKALAAAASHLDGKLEIYEDADGDESDGVNEGGDGADGAES